MRTYAAIGIALCLFCEGAVAARADQDSGGQPAKTNGQGSREDQGAASEKEMQAQKNKALNEAYNSGMTAFQAKDYTIAIDSFKRAAELDPKQSAVWIQLAQSYDGLARTKTGAEKDAALASASENYLKALELLPTDAGLHNNYGLLLAQQKKFSEAQAALEKAAELDPPEAGKYYYNWGLILRNTGQHDAAKAAFKKAKKAGYPK